MILFVAESIVYGGLALMYLALFSYCVHQWRARLGGTRTVSISAPVVRGFPFYSCHLGVVISAVCSIASIDPHSAHGLIPVPGPILMYDLIGSLTMAAFSIWVCDQYSLPASLPVAVRPRAALNV
jgi:hypothetical protein